MRPWEALVSQSPSYFPRLAWIIAIALPMTVLLAPPASALPIAKPNISLCTPPCSPYSDLAALAAFSPDPRTRSRKFEALEREASEDEDAAAYLAQARRLSATRLPLGLLLRPQVLWHLDDPSLVNIVRSADRLRMRPPAYLTFPGVGGTGGCVATLGLGGFQLSSRLATVPPERGLRSMVAEAPAWFLRYGTQLWRAGASKTAREVAVGLIAGGLLVGVLDAVLAGSDPSALEQPTGWFGAKWCLLAPFGAVLGIAAWIRIRREAQLRVARKRPRAWLLRVDVGESKLMMTSIEFASRREARRHAIRVLRASRQPEQFTLVAESETHGRLELRGRDNSLLLWSPRGHLGQLASLRELLASSLGFASLSSAMGDGVTF